MQADADTKLLTNCEATESFIYEPSILPSELHQLYVQLTTTSCLVPITVRT